MIFVDDLGFYLGHQHTWSDWALHISLTQIFAQKPIADWFFSHPYFAGGQLTYGFLTHLISGILVRIGFDIGTTQILVGIFLSLVLIYTLYHLANILLRSQKQAILSVYLFFLSSGLGFVNYLYDFWQNPSWEMVTFPPLDYTRLEQYDWYSGNIILAILLPQKAFLSGIVLATISLIFYFKGIETKDKKHFITAGILAGLLPITHMHSFIMLALVTGISSLIFLVMNFFQQKDNPETIKKLFINLFIYAIFAGTISIFFYYFFIHGGIQRANFMRIDWGWRSDGSFLNWLYMWFEIWGIIPFIAFLGGIFFANKKTKIFLFANLILFLIANVVVFQPTAWDNSKIFTYSYFAISMSASVVIGKLLANGGIINKIVSVILVIFFTFSGILEIARLQQFEKHTFLLNSNKEIAVAKKIAMLTEHKSVFATAPIHNHPINVWAGRTIYLGYGGWIENFGFSYGPRYDKLLKIYSGHKDALQIIKEDKIDYLYLSDIEREQFKTVINYAFLSQFEKILDEDGIIIYKMK